MTQSKGKTKNTKREKTKRESEEMSPAKKLFRQYYPFYKYTPNGIKGSTSAKCWLSGR